jgi:hypothetical protein
MPRGGARIGAGRPSGSRTVNTNPREGDAARVGSDLLPIDYLLGVMRDPKADPVRRDRCASALLPYLHPRQAEAYVGRKGQIERTALTAGRGTAWEPLLNRVEERGAPTPQKDGRWADVIHDD